MNTTTTAYGHRFTLALLSEARETLKNLTSEELEELSFFEKKLLAEAAKA